MPVLMKLTIHRGEPDDKQSRRGVKEFREKSGDPPVHLDGKWKLNGKDDITGGKIEWSAGN